jgi:predicted lysophospholipase L1 biosynthesis ABC-type transport system permease subunit
LHLSEQLYLIGALAAALLSALAAAFALAASARSRAVLLARLAALGMARRQALVLGLTDAVPLVAVAAIGTVAASWLLVEVIGPVLGLNVFTGSAAPVTLRPTWPGLIVPLAGVTVLALLFLAIDGAASGRRELGAALREEEAA